MLCLLVPPSEKFQQKAEYLVRDQSEQVCSILRGDMGADGWAAGHLDKRVH